MNTVKFICLFIIVLVAYNLPVIALDIEHVGTLDFETFFNSTNTLYSLSSICKDENYFYAMFRASGLAVIEWQYNTEPKLVGQYDGIYDFNDMVIRGNHAYLAIGRFKINKDFENNGIINIDLSDPYNPREVARYKTPEYVQHIYLKDDYLFATEGMHSLKILDVSNSSAFTFVSKVPVVSLVQDIYITATYAFLICMDNGLQVYGLADINKPVFSGSYSNHADKLAVRGSYAFVANILGCLNIYDITIPDRIHKISQYVEKRSGGYYSPDIDDLALYNDYIFALESGKYIELLLLDISDVLNPRLIDRWEFDTYYSDLTIIDDDLLLYGGNKLKWFKIIQ